MEKLIIGNLKMNILTPVERDRYFESFKTVLKQKNFSRSHIVLCPPVLHMETFAKKIKHKSVSFGAQNIFWEDRGSFTGEVSSLMVKNFGGEFVIVGHSERRKYFGETDAIINGKMQAALKANVVPVLCVGESQEQHQQGKTGSVIIGQLEHAFAEVPLAKLSKVVIAYEPIWAVGTDLVPTEHDILVVKILIKKFLTDHFGASVAEKIKILYGGSVNAKTVQQVCNQPEMDGVLVGRESLIPVEFLKIAEIIDQK